MVHISVRHVCIRWPVPFWWVLICFIAQSYNRLNIILVWRPITRFLTCLTLSFCTGCEICAESDLAYWWFSMTHSFTTVIICIKGKISYGQNASLIGFWYHYDKSQRRVFWKSWEVIYQFLALITLDSSVNEMF